ncbi:hypothetical protein HELRODRAFT_137730, partial [Helobdella robusta]|uniref:Doublecortin domain-containing protein n=1 Tax=Helobdella robusta TaxID=6412 RepID=T1EIN0_HELRO
SFSCSQRAVRVKFYRNGDKYFTGLLYPLNFSRYKDFETLLKDLSSSNFCDKRIMPFGVRTIFTLSGIKITSVNQMEEGESYVCSSSNLFVPMDYINQTCNPKW